MNKPILVLDFDGVIHQYTSPWTTATEIRDPPVEGAIEFIIEASKYFIINIFSSRTRDPGGIEAMREWLKDYWISYGHDGPEEWECFNDIQWPNEKPAAFLTIDDRGYTFSGVWPEPETLLKFKPWNRGGNFVTICTDDYDQLDS